MSNFLNGLKKDDNYTLTENLGVTHKTTDSALLDLFAFGASMRGRSDEDVILKFKNAYEENPVYALKCLFYIRDVRGGQGERRFFRVCFKWLSIYYPMVAVMLIDSVPIFGRWDDLFCLLDTPLRKNVLTFINGQLIIDQKCNTPSLLAKWMPSENASSKETKRLAKIFISELFFTPQKYRKMLSSLRAKINILERLMSEQRWEEIQFDKISSRAGFIYRNAFARNDLLRERYSAFMEDKKTKVHSGTLYPYEIVEKALAYKTSWSAHVTEEERTTRESINKYWENLPDYFNGDPSSILTVIDTSGSMNGTPINAAISLGLYCAEHSTGEFADYYISFSSTPQLIRCNGVDFVDKVKRIYQTNLCENTDIEKTFDLLLKNAIKNRLSQSDLPKTIVIISDMEFDCARSSQRDFFLDRRSSSLEDKETVMEGIERKWKENGYKMPHLVYWNVDARQDNIPMIGEGLISFVSGFSPVIFQAILTSKSGYDLMMEVLNSKRYEGIS